MQSIATFATSWCLQRAVVGAFSDLGARSRAEEDLGNLSDLQDLNSSTV